jgi:hypothetical protein
MPHPDAELLSLGSHLIEEEARALRAEAAFDELHNQILDRVESVATWPEDQDEWTQEDAQAYCGVLRGFSDAAGEPYHTASEDMHRVGAVRCDRRQHSGQQSENSRGAWHQGAGSAH